MAIPAEAATCSVAVNHWIQCAVLLTVRIFVAGWSWGWTLPPSDRPDRSRFWESLRVGASAAFCGLLINLLLVIALAETSQFSPRNDVGLFVIVCGAGFALGLANARKRVSSLVFQTLPIALLFLVAAAAIMLMSSQGEWIVGGWDPGTYVDQAVYVSRTGSFRPLPDPAFASLRNEEIRLFTRPVFTFTEGLPVFPLDPQTRSYRLFFFRLTPAFMAMLERAGGLRAVVRANMFAGVLSALAFAGMMISLFERKSWRTFAVLMLIVQPIWVYHLHIPISEVLQLFLVTSVLSLLPLRTRGESGRMWFIMGLFTLMLNRIAFLPFGCLLLLVASGCDLSRSDRSAVARERAAGAVALLAGLVFNIVACHVGVIRLGSFFYILLLASLVPVLGAVVLEVIAAEERRRLAAIRVLPAFVIVGLALSVAMVLGGAYLLRLSRLSEFARNIASSEPYFGGPLVIFAVAGLVVLGFKRGQVAREGWGTILFLLSATAVLFVDGAIAELYPWATRRYLVYTVPLAAILAGAVLGALWDTARIRPMISKVSAIALAALICIVGGRQSLKAWQSTEYDGLSARLSEVAEHIGDGDLVVADHFLFGVPLRFIHDRPVLNGMLLCRELKGHDLERALIALKRLSTRGWRIRFLTSTPAGMDIFPFMPDGISEDWSWPPFSLREIEHSGSGDGFNTRTFVRQFRLYTWQPALDVERDGGLWRDSMDVDIGTGVGTPYNDCDAAYLLSGFHDGEIADGGRTVRWTDGNGVFGLYVRKPRAELEAEVYYLDTAIPETVDRVAPSMVLNGQPIECVTSDDPSDPGVRITSARIPTGLFRDGLNKLGIVSASWLPAEHLGSPDDRRLGIMIDRIVIRPVQD
jgi:hypothetical protein